MVTESEGKIFKGQPRSGGSFTQDKFESLGHLFIDRLTGRHKDTILFLDAVSGRGWTGAEISDRVFRIASALISVHSFQTGTAVCISYDHSVETTILALAVIVAGGMVACAYDKDPYAELLYLAERIEPRFLFCGGKNAEWAKLLEQDLGIPVKLVMMDGENTRADAIHLGDLMNYDLNDNACLKSLPVVPENLDEAVAFITMSSGTTGKPKAIPVTHRNCLDDMLLLPQRDSRGLKVLSVASLDYVSGRIIISNAIEFGYTAVISNNCSPESLLPAIEKYKINVVYMGAASFYSLISHRDRKKHDLSSIRVIFPMGAKIIYLDELREFLRENPQIVQISQGYGASELSGAAIKRMTPEQYLSDPDNCGLLDRHMEAKIVDRDTGKLLGTNQHGLLCIRGNTLTPGYYDIRRTKQGKSPFIRDPSSFDEDGFYITGDIAYFNDKEELYIIGREKELMWCRGAKKVLPCELEELIEEHPATAKVCVLGIPNQRELTLHCPRAFVVVKSSYYTDSEIKLSGRLRGQQVDGDDRLEHKGDHKLCGLPAERRRAIAEDMMQFVDERIGWEKQLTGGIVVLDDIPTLRATGKMDKRYLRSLTLEQVEIFGDRSG